MQLVVQPTAGLEPVLAGLERAKKTIDIVIFRLDIKDITSALEAAVKRGVAVRALIAHAHNGPEKALRKLEVRLLAAGVTVSRSADDLARYHGKMVIVDGTKLYVNGFNFTWLDIGHSRSFGVITTTSRIVKEASKLFQADCDRQPYAATCDRFVVSPVNARERLTQFIEGAKRQILIYDPNANDRRLLRALTAKAAAGVDVRIIGKVSGRSGLKAEKCPGRRLHVRALIRDGRQAFIGSQSLRGRELDRRREIGIIINEPKVVKGLLSVFEEDWAQAVADKKPPPSETDAPPKASTQDRGRVAVAV
jgi:cardiolipin synthase